MTNYLKIALICICFFVIGLSQTKAQQLIQSGKFTYIPVFDNQAILIKEIPLSNISSKENYTNLKNWVKENFTTDLINSSIMYYNDEQAVLVKSKVDLLLPLLNTNNEGEKSVLSYHLYAFIKGDVCVIQISNMEYKVVNAVPALKQKIRAEDFVSSQALKISDEYTKERIETQKGTLYFFNELTDKLEKMLN